MVRAAIYARKSQLQDDAASVTRQVENSRVFATAKGWTVLDEHVYVDDGRSGSLRLARLLNKNRMLTAVTSMAPPPFDVLIVQDADRLSRRDGDEAFAELKTIARAGVDVWFYSDGTAFEYGTFAANTLSFLRGEFAAEYRRAVSRKTYEAHRRMASLGHVTGGRVFGYDNVAVDTHVERRVNEGEAEVVRRIFDLRASGLGYSGIAKRLNVELAACPRPQQDRPAGWSPSTVRDVLHRDLYRGLVIWNRTKKRDISGDVAPMRRAASEWLRTSREDLRMVTDAQWDAAHARIQHARVTLPTETGTRTVARRDLDSKYLLTGHARCGTCGGALTVVSRKSGGRRIYFYGCLTNWKRGAAVCANSLVLPMARVDAAVLTALAGDVLRPALVTAIIDSVLEQLVPRNVEAQVDGLRRQLRALETKIARLTDAIENGGADVSAIIARQAERQTEREALLAEIASAETLFQIEVDREAIERQVQDAVGQWRELLTGSMADARQMLREVLPAPLRFTPEGQTYRFKGPVATGALIAGAVLPTKMASPTGFDASWQVRMDGFSDLTAA